MAFHARSVSLPSGSHPLTLSIEDQLDRLRVSEATSSSSSLTIYQKFGDLKDLYECLDSLLQLPLTQRAFSYDMLDGCLRLLDLCGTTRDVFSQMKCCVQDLESSIRRRNGRESSLTTQIEKYVSSRKNIRKTVLKCSATLKRIKMCNSTLLNKENNLSDMASTLGQVQAVSITMFETLLSFVCPTKDRSKSVGQSLVSKFIKTKNDRENTNGIETLDTFVDSLIKHKSSKGCSDVVEVQNVQKRLKEMESTMQEVEQGLESIFRSLIKTRVSLLNILNH